MSKAGAPRRRQKGEAEEGEQADAEPKAAPAPKKKRPAKKPALKTEDDNGAEASSTTDAAPASETPAAPAAGKPKVTTCSFVLTAERSALTVFPGSSKKAAAPVSAPADGEAANGIENTHLLCWGFLLTLLE